MNRVTVYFDNNDSTVEVTLKKFLEILDVKLTESEIETLIRKIASSQ